MVNKKEGSQSDLISSLNWRYATKKFDSSKKVSEKDLNELLEAMRLTPSSFGIQPWKFLVVTNKEIREKIKGAAWGQAQVTDASHLIVLCIRKGLDKKYMSEYVKFVESERGFKSGMLKGFEKMLHEYLDNFSGNVEDWSKKQVYLVLGNLLTSAALKKIDACPMEGFDAAKVNEILGLEKKGLGAVLMCPIGFRASDDKYANHKKVRFSLKKIVEKID
ncbi:MAG: NAD(P)H-dependent oxidoreductase [Nanoarchaeota archaeon]